MFFKEELIVRREFLKNFRNVSKILLRCLKIIESDFASIKVTPDSYSEYSAALLATHNLKSLYSSYDRLSRGYMSDAETILKRVIEAFLAQVYFFENNDKARDWLKGIKIGKLEINRRKMAKTLDNLSLTKQIFPTDYEKFFEEYIYKVGYSGSNKIAHLDFDYVHKEVNLDSHPKYYATSLVIGPKYDPKFMEVILNRLLIFSMFQLSYIRTAFKLPDSRSYKILFTKFRKIFSPV